MYELLRGSDAQLRGTNEAVMTRPAMHPLKVLAVVGAAFLVWGLLFAYASSPAQAATLTVNSLADGAPAYDGQCTLREAILNANADDRSGSTVCAAGSGSDTVHVGVTGTVQLSGALPNLSSNLKIEGPGADQFTVRRNTGGDYRIFIVTSDGSEPVVSISGITISNGNASQTLGGGILNFGTLTVTGFTISGNSAHRGGGISNHNNLTTTRSTISGNYADLGGGIYSDTGNLYNLSKKTTVTNSTISGNSSPRGGGVLNWSGLTVVEHSTITKNTAPSGGGSGVASSADVNTRTDVLSSIISENTNTDVDFLGVIGISPNTFRSNGYNLIGDGNATYAFYQGGDQTNVGDPKLGALADNGGPTQTHALLAGSPAIDKGNSDHATDQRGEKRPFDDPSIAPTTGGDNSDIGSFEAQSVLNSAPQAADDTYSTNEDTALTVAAPAGVLSNDTYLDSGDTLAAVLVSGPSHANSFELNANGSFSYTPKPNYNGPDSFTYKATDGTEDSNTATVSIEVNPVDDAPKIAVVAGSASQSACLSDTTGRITLKLSDADSNLGDLKPSVTGSSDTSLVPKSNIAFGGTGGTRTATISTVAGRTGTSTVTITVSDGQGSSSVPVTVKSGGKGRDTLGGTSGADLLLGQNGDDTLSGAGGNDLLCGANGNDKLSGGTGSDTFDGGSGTDAATDYNATQGDSRTNIP